MKQAQPNSESIVIKKQVQLDCYQKGSYTTGASLFKRSLWYFLGQPLLYSYLLPFSSLKVSILRIFGAKIGKRVNIKPGVRIKYPWRFEVKDYSWIGEDAWIDNLAQVTIGSHCCISQGAYLCTGNHSWSKPSFNLMTSPIILMDSTWVGAKAIVSPGTCIQVGVVLTAGSVASGELEAWSIYQGNPAKKVKSRNLENCDS